MNLTQEIRIEASEIACLRNPRKADIRDLASGTKWRNLLTGELWMLMSLIKTEKPDKLKLVWLKIKKADETMSQESTTRESPTHSSEGKK